jgi:hypothetical protein
LSYELSPFRENASPLIVRVHPVWRSVVSLIM